MARIESLSKRKKGRHRTGIARDLVNEERFLPISNPQSPVTEKYRRLKTFIDHIAEREQRPIRSVVVSSSHEDEGKTLTSMNLALSLAEDRDRSVLLVDCDLHRPSVHRILRSPARMGLMDIYRKKADLDSCVISLVKSRLHILPAGDVRDASPAAILVSERFRDILARLKERYDRIVFDTPPVMRFVDANVLNEMCDGMIFVVRARRTARQMVSKALASVTSGRILGLVLNDVRYTVVDRYYYRYDEYGKSYYDD